MAIDYNTHKQNRMRHLISTNVIPAGSPQEAAVSHQLDVLAQILDAAYASDTSAKDAQIAELANENRLLKAELAKYPKAGLPYGEAQGSGSDRYPAGSSWTSISDGTTYPEDYQDTAKPAVNGGEIEGQGVQYPQDTGNADILPADEAGAQKVESDLGTQS